MSTTVLSIYAMHRSLSLLYFTYEIFSVFCSILTSVYFVNASAIVKQPCLSWTLTRKCCLRLPPMRCLIRATNKFITLSTAKIKGIEVGNVATFKAKTSIFFIEAVRFNTSKNKQFRKVSVHCLGWFERYFNGEHIKRGMKE